MPSNNIPDLIQQMKKPEFYPHPVKEPIELIQTHISYILLTGDYTYKLKKPVDFGFLDFSTIAKRQHFLGEELRMNKPIAPEIYLEVLPITKQNNNYVLGGLGEPVEYALKMQQFPQENLLINMFDRGTLTEAHLEKLGKVVAQFHDRAPTNDYISSFGRVDRLKESIEDNYRKTAKYIGLLQTQQQYEDTKHFTDTFLEKTELFNKRIEQNKVRECHGDLHLKNICWWQNKIQLFDRIEFNEPFRFVDVMYDVAFVVMDLEARGRQDFANIFLNTYIEQTGDWEGLQVLPLYLSRQAYVRAKVTSFLLDDRAISQTEKQQAAKSASNYYQLAAKYTKIKQEKLILMSGLSGSGKTTIARKIAKEINAIQIRSDAVRKHLVGIPLTEKGDDRIYTPQISEKTYDRLLELGGMLVNQGFSVILDAKYDRHSLRQKAIDLAQSQQIPLQIIYCTAPSEVLLDRLSQRTGDISDATPNLLTHQQESFEPFTEVEKTYLTTIDTLGNR